MVLRLRVEVEHLLHLGDEASGIAFGNAETLLSPGLKRVFLSVQRTRPCGGGEQQMATSAASALPSILGGTGGVRRSLRAIAGCSPCRTKSLRTRATVLR